jgi:hypothetical protein
VRVEFLQPARVHLLDHTQHDSLVRFGGHVRFSSIDLVIAPSAHNAADLAMERV